MSRACTPSVQCDERETSQMGGRKKEMKATITPTVAKQEGETNGMCSLTFRLKNQCLYYMHTHQSSRSMFPCRRACRPRLLRRHKLMRPWQMTSTPYLPIYLSIYIHSYYSSAFSYICEPALLLPIHLLSEALIMAAIPTCRPRVGSGGTGGADCGGGSTCGREALAALALHPLTRTFKHPHDTLGVACSPALCARQSPCTLAI